MTDKLKPLFIIPARGGSKGIPGKNIKPLGGRPLIAYTIDVAKAAAEKYGVGEANILLSTDSPEIASVVSSCGLPVPYMRPAEFATDRSGSREVMLHAADWASSHGIEFNCIVLLQPTSPFREVGDVEAALECFARCHPDMAVTVKAAESNPYTNCYETDANGVLHMSKGDGCFVTRQEAPAAWQMNGAVYVINPASLKKYTLGAMPCRVPVEMPAERSVDIDTPLDWVVAEALLAFRQSPEAANN